MKETIYHLYHKKGRKHYYFGSIAAIFSTFKPEVIDITQKGLYKHEFEQPFENDKIIIDKGRLIRSKQQNYDSSIN